MNKEEVKPVSGYALCDELGINTVRLGMECIKDVQVMHGGKIVEVLITPVPTCKESLHVQDKPTVGEEYKPEIVAIQESVNKALKEECARLLNERQSLQGDFNALEKECEQLRFQPCQYVVTSKEGTSYCSLAESSVKDLQAKLDKAVEALSKIRIYCESPSRVSYNHVILGTACEALSILSNDGREAK